jgi:hypothetical protein
MILVVREVAPFALRLVNAWSFLIPARWQILGSMKNLPGDALLKE